MNPKQDVLKQAFNTYAGKDGAIDAKELKHVLKAVFHGSKFKYTVPARLNAVPETCYP
jgi:Ca2+-binding EF-hand superfamily protein